MNETFNLVCEALLFSCGISYEEGDTESVLRHFVEFLTQELEDDIYERVCDNLVQDLDNHKVERVTKAISTYLGREMRNGVLNYLEDTARQIEEDAGVCKD